MSNSLDPAQARQDVKTVCKGYQQTALVDKKLNALHRLLTLSLPQLCLGNILTISVTNRNHNFHVTPKINDVHNQHIATCSYTKFHQASLNNF